MAALPSDPPPIGRVQAVVYVRGSDPLEEATSVARCEKWAAAHDWHVSEVIRESTDAEQPLARAGLVGALALIQESPVSVLLAATCVELAEDRTDFQEVCLRVEKLGGFVHVLDISKETPHVP